MYYSDARIKALYLKWSVYTCNQGEKCWCRVIKCQEPLMYKEYEGDDEQEYNVVGPGLLDKETVEHIVRLHNDSIK